MVPSSPDISLKHATRAAHNAAERTHLARALIGQEPLTVGDWRRHLTNSMPCYEAVESRVPVLAELGLLRSPLIAADIASMRGPSDGPLLPGTVAYVQHVLTLSEEQALAHVYVRWLGDLYGGQIIGRRLHGRMPCSHLFFDDPKAAIGVVRGLIAGKDAILVEEANRCFSMIQRIYEEVMP